MAERPDLRAEEARFLTDMPSVLGQGAVRALERVGKQLDLDYAGVDFGLSRRGELLFFEANAAMTIVPPEPDPIWDYRRAAVEQALAAARALMFSRAGVRSEVHVA
jgi:hypothetical protein